MVQSEFGSGFTPDVFLSRIISESPSLFGELIKMRTAYLQLYEEEVRIVLGVRLLFWGVPFHRTKKPGLSPRMEAASDDVRTRLLKLRDAAWSNTPNAEEGASPETDGPFVFLPLTSEEVRAYVTMTEACLSECGDDEIDLRLHLHVSNREEVERVFERLQQMER